MVNLPDAASSHPLARLFDGLFNRRQVDADMTAPTFRFAQRTRRFAPSMILELMKLMGRPGLVSLGGLLAWRITTRD